MKLRHILLFVASLLAVATLTATGLAGKWTSEFDSQIGVQKYVFVFTGEGAALAGKATHEHSLGKGEAALQDIKVDGTNVSFVEPFTLDGTTITIIYSGTLHADTMDLKRQVGDFATEQIVAKRVEGGTVAAGRPAEPDAVAAAALLVFGHLPAATEAGAGGTITELIAQDRATLSGNPAAQQAVAAKAFRDAFGRAPTAGEIAGATGTYTELVQQHVKSLAANPAEYSAVLNRVYQLVIRRDVYPEEIEYWKKHDVQSFAVLVGCVDNWGRRNQPGLMVTAGPTAVSLNSVYLTTVRLAPAAAAEARAAAGLAAPADAAAGTHVLAAGAEKIISDGRIHFAAVLKD